MLKRKKEGMKEGEFDKTKEVRDTTTIADKDRVKAQTKLYESGAKALRKLRVSASADNKAYANDMLLHAIMKIPRGDRKDAFDKMMKRIKKDLQGEGIIGDRQAEIAQDLLGRQSSVDQISRFASAELSRSKNTWIATNIEADVTYGADVLKLKPRFDKEREVLILQLSAFNAKASKKGIDAEGVRKVSNQYREKRDTFLESYTGDTNWAMEKIFGEGVRDLPLSDSQKLDGLMDNVQRAKMVKALQAQKTSPYGKFAAESRAILAMNAVAQDLGEDLIPYPNVEIETEYLYLLETKKGDEILTQEEADYYR